MAFRRRRPPVLVIAGLVVAVLVIVVLALPGSDSSSDQQSYLDIVRPQLQLSAQQGAVVRDIRANARSLDRLTLVQRVNDLVGAAAGVQRQVAPVSPPGSLGSAGSPRSGWWSPTPATRPSTRYRWWPQCRAASHSRRARSSTSSPASVGPSTSAACRSGRARCTSSPSRWVRSPETPHPPTTARRCR